MFGKSVKKNSLIVMSLVAICNAQDVKNKNLAIIEGVLEEFLVVLIMVTIAQAPAAENKNLADICSRKVASE